MKQIYIHLISDSSGETLKGVVKSSLAQFDNIQAKTYLWPLVRTDDALKACIKKIEKKPGIVLYIIAHAELREKVKSFCLAKKLPCIGILGKIIKEMSAYLGIAVNNDQFTEFKMDGDYFERMEAIDYTLKHDDGQKTSNFEEADIVLLGPSRTSKSPTCVYLAFNGLKAANMPIISGINLPNEILNLNSPLIVGLTIDPKRLIEVRNTRINVTSQTQNTDYTDYDKVIQECREAKKIFISHGWPIIDVTVKSVEEIAADIIKMFYERKLKLGQKIFYN